MDGRQSFFLNRLFMVTAIVFCLFLSRAFASGTGTATATGSVVVPVATLVSCVSTMVTANPGTQTTTLTVTCTLSGNPNSLSSNANSFTYPSTLVSNGHSLTVTPVSTVSSPDGSMTGISGTYSAFNANLSTGTNNTWKVQSTCTIHTTASTPSGSYTGTVVYNWSTL